MAGILNINLAAIEQNYSKLHRGDPLSVAAVVKADAYGLGVERVSKKLWEAGCKEFFVAEVSEGVTLRKILSSARIYVLEGFSPDQIESLVKNNLIPVLNTPEQCRLWIEVSESSVVHLDTGMERLGLSIEEFVEVSSSNRLKIEMLMSHFARADEPDHPFNQIQIKRFLDAHRLIKERFPFSRISLNNSAACLAGISELSDCETLVRGGIALYGSSPFRANEGGDALATVASLSAQVIQIRRVKAGSGLGYGSTFSVDKDSDIAIVGLGYADGLPRLLSNRGYCAINGRRFPIRGTISMDTFHVDVSDADVCVGDVVQIFGDAPTLREVAEHASTIDYEILTGLGRRLERVYFD